MNASTRLTLRLAIPVISLAALALAGEPVRTLNDAALADAAGTTLAIACEETPASDADASEQRSRTAMRLRWAVTLPDSSRPLSIRLLP